MLQLHLSQLDERAIKWQMMLGESKPPNNVHWHENKKQSQVLNNAQMLFERGVTE